jgi:hypothetical protein
MVGNENTIFGKLYHFFGQFIEFWGASKLVIANPVSAGCPIFNGNLRIYQGRKFLYYLLPIVNQDADFSDPVILSPQSGGFCFNYGVH